ncbi:DUF6153 family protein [Streptomyces sp. KLOTTS4A1]|uniref:DUF6153 family protein n=1 Tax=Streptomyces sp. KLOTTS4A1 TaxID=3390996 RepID=UPI0039F5A464
MAGRVVTRWRALLAVCAVAAVTLGHGFAGAATHLPHHPDHALVTHAVSAAGSAPHAGGAEPHHDGHDGTACDILPGGGAPHLHLVASGLAASWADERLAALSCATAVQARAPPKPSLDALSVLRI